MKFALLARLCIVIFCIHNMTLNAAYPINQQWLQKNSSNFKIIFQENDEQKANDLLNFLEHHHKKLNYEQAPLSKQFPIILHPFYSQSNGFVAWLPRRSELYTLSSPQTYTFLGNNEWLHLLAIHEYRHIAQHELILSKQMFSQLYNLFGELYPSVFSNVYMSSWYFEGDAVITESTASNYGRGREANFTRLARMNVMEYKPFSYNKQILGSLKQPISNHYETGYIILNYLHKTYGEETYNNIIHKTFDSKLFGYALSHTLKKELKLSKAKLYKKAFEELKNEQEKLMLPPDPKSKKINKRTSKDYSSFLYPIEHEDHSIIAFNTSYKDINHFIKINKNGSSQKIINTGRVKKQLFNAISKKYIAWVNNEQHPLYDNIYYSNIVLFDQSKNKIVAKSKNAFFDTVSLSKNGKTALALEQDPKNNTTLSILSLPTLSIQKKAPLTDGAYTFLHYTESNDFLAIKTKAEQKSVVLINNQTFAETVLYSTYENIGTPRKLDNMLFFTLSFEGNDKICVVDLIKKKRYIFAESSYGSYYPSISKDKTHLIYNQFEKHGFDILKKPISLNNLTEINYNEAQKREIDLSHPNTFYETKPFQAWKYYFQPIEYQILPESNSIYTFMFSSRDLMGHMTLSNILNYDLNQKLYDNSLALSFTKYIPELTLSYNYANKKSKSGSNTYKWDENDLTLGLSFPWIKSQKDFVKRAEFNTEFSSTILSNYSINNINYQIINDSLNYITFETKLSNTQDRAYQAVSTRWHQSISAKIHKTITDSYYKGSYQDLSITLNFPGVKKTHSLQTNSLISSQNSPNYSFYETITYVEGYTFNQSFNSFFGLKVEYHLPLLYPELSFSSWFYLKRLKFSTFLHQAKINYGEESKTPTYIGSRLHFESRAAQIDVPLEFTFSFYYSPNENDNGILFYISL